MDKQIEVERVAQVLAKASGARWEKVSEYADDPDLDWGSRDYWRRLARAAIATLSTENGDALREAAESVVASRCKPGGSKEHSDALDRLSAALSTKGPEV